MVKTAAMLLGALIAASVIAASVVMGSTKPTIPYTAGQAQRGQFVFLQNCALCHNTDLSGRFAPALAGEGANLSMKTLGFVYSYMTAHMPMGNAGGLSDRDYTDVMAFLLQANGVHAGSRPLLSSEAIKSQVIIGTAR